MEFEEWKNYPLNCDGGNLCSGYILSDNARFLMEGTFYTQLQNVRNLFPDKFTLIIKAINDRVFKNHKVYFVHDFELPILSLKDYIYLEISDVLDPMGIIVDDNSRGSDYGD